MKKVLTWLGITLGATAGFLMMRYGLPLLLMAAFLLGLEMEHDALNNDAEEALTQLGLTHIVEYCTTDDLTIDGVMSAFPVYQYDDADNDVHAALMAHLVTAEDWHIGIMTSGVFAEQLAAQHPEAAFLLPEESITFDAWYTGADALAWFDRDSRLFIYMDKAASPTPGEFKADGITVPHTGYLYEMETHGGFFGDGDTYRACIVPEAAHPALEEALAAHADWHESPITREEYLRLHRHEFWSVPDLFPAEAVTFDWWCYVDTYARAHPGYEPDYIADNSNFPAAMQELGEHFSPNWLCALYDADTGLFIYYEYDS